MRRLGVVAGGQPDLLGDDAQIDTETWTERVMVFFPDPPENLYQVRQWLPALEALHTHAGVLIVTQDSRTARALRGDTSLPVKVVATHRTLDGAVRRSNLGLALYVGQSNANAVALRLNRLAHVFLSHGESDKLVTVSNLEKAFDRVFIAGAAARDRHSRALVMFDSSVLREIGRPQALSPSEPDPDAPFTVLYAPTWEGTQEVNQHSSVLSHGTAIIDSVAATPGAHLIVRPHPRTGRTDAVYRAGVEALRDAVSRARSQVEWDDTYSPDGAMERAHVLITDVSAIAIDWLGTERPLLITTGVSPTAATVGSRLLDEAPRLRTEDAPNAVARAVELHTDTTVRSTVSALRAHYLGDRSPSEALDAFINECLATLDERDRAWAAIDDELRSA